MIPKKAWEMALEEAEDKAKYDQKLSIIGSDIDKEASELSKHNAQEAGVGHEITFRHRDIAQLDSKEEYGTLICNPPYGERLGEKKEIEALYRKMGRIFQSLPTWSYYIFTAHEEFETLFGKKATKKRKLFSGNIRCDFYQYFGPRPPKPQQVGTEESSE